MLRTRVEEETERALTTDRSPRALMFPESVYRLTHALGTALLQKIQ